MKTMKTFLLSAAAFFSVAITNAQNFTVQRNVAKINLAWESNGVENANHFIVERSYNGTEFTEIAIVFAFEADAKRSPYKFVDKTVSSNNSSVYYRIRYINKDGKEGSFPGQMVEFENKVSKTELARL